VKVFKHCCDMLSIDGTSLTGKYEYIMLITIDIDTDRQLVPLAFVIMEKEYRCSCDMLSIHHRWCTRHLDQNLIKHDGIKENFKLFEELCRQTDEKDFKKKLKDLEKITNKKGKEFLKELMDEKEKWPLAYDKGDKRCGYMTSNMAGIFNSILRGIRSLSVTTIASFTFYKCNEWFVKWLVDVQMIQTHHSDYVVMPNIYLDTKIYEACAQGMYATCFDIQARKYEVLEGGGMTSGSEHYGAKRFTVNLS
jgi:hypothetical protein